MHIFTDGRASLTLSTDKKTHRRFTEHVKQRKIKLF